MTTTESKADYDRKELLVWGYIRDIEKMYIHFNIPIEINDIIYLYQRFYDAWCQKYKAECVEIDADQSMVSIDTKSGVTVYGEEVIKQGIHEWKVNIISFKIFDGSSFPHIGIIENDEDVLLEYLTNTNFDDFGHLFCGGVGDAYSFAEQLDDIKANFVWMKKGDTLVMKLDLNKGKLYFKMNDSDDDQLYIDVGASPTGYRFALAVSSKSQFRFVV